MSSMIEIFDSLTHPTVDNTWLNSRFNGNCGFAELVSYMRLFGITKAFAVGMGGVGGYSAEAYIRLVQSHASLLPIAFCETHCTHDGLEALKALGYVGIKIHPRISGIAPDDDRIFDHIRYANRIGLCVLYCGFLGTTEKFVREIGEERLVFLHTGGRELVRTFQMLQHKTNILFDLSYTMMRYPELWEDIVRLCKTHSKHFCVGSDHPEATLRALREGFDLLTGRIGYKNASLIGCGNLENFMRGSHEIVSRSS